MLASPELCWPPRGHWLQLSHPAVTVQTLQASFLFYLPETRERQPTATSHTAAGYASLLSLCVLLTSRYECKQDQAELHPRLKPSHQISQQLVALIKHICKPVSHVAHLGTTNGTTNTFLFVMGSEPHHTCTDFSFFQPFFYCSKVPDGNEHDVLVLYRVPHPHPDSDLNWTHSAYHNTN